MRTQSAIGVALLFLLKTTTLASAQAACPADQPCINSILINGRGGPLTINVVNARGYDRLNVRWSRPGRQGKQSSYGGGDGEIDVLSATSSGVLYTVSVQGCRTRVLQSSRCTDWHEAQVRGR